MKKLNGERLRFVGTVGRFGTKPAYRGPAIRTILLLDVHREGEPDQILTDHLWFNCGTTFDRLGLRPGDKVSFDARVSRYEKGYTGRRAWETGEAWSETDYRLERPTKAVRMRSEVDA
jgi:hypothetical protein